MTGEQSTTPSCEKDAVVLVQTPCGVKEFQEHAKTTRMWLSALAVLLVGVGGSLALSIGAPALVFYKGQNSSLEEPMTEAEGATFASSFMLATACGCLLCWPSVRFYGRKTTILGGGGILLASWGMLYFSHTVELIIASRFFMGIGRAIVTTTNYMLLNEISTIKLRGVMGMLETLTINVAWGIGIYLYGFSGLSFQDLIGCLTASLLPMLVLASLLVEESPLWLVKIGKTKEARAALERLRGSDYLGLEVEMEELVKCCSGGESDESSSTASNFVKPFLLLSSLFFFQASSGLDLMSHYSLEMIYELLGGNVQLGNALGTLFQVGFAVGYLSSTPMLRRCRRRRQVIVSALLSGATITSLGIFFRVQKGLDERSQTLDYLTMLTIPTSSFVYGLGLGPVYFTLLGELFPARYKAAGTAIICSIRSLFVAAINKSYPAAKSVLGLDGVLLASAAMAFVGAGVTFFFLPETKGKTLTELSALFGGDVKGPDKSAAAAAATLLRSQHPSLKR